VVPGAMDGDMHDAYSFIATSICLEFVLFDIDI
jgi:hypothetical protein